MTMTFFESLDDDILKSILSYVDGYKNSSNACLVAKKWNTYCQPIRNETLKQLSPKAFDTMMAMSIVNNDSKQFTFLVQHIINKKIRDVSPEFFWYIWNKENKKLDLHHPYYKNEYDGQSLLYIALDNKAHEMIQFLLTKMQEKSNDETFQEYVDILPIDVQKYFHNHERYKKTRPWPELWVNVGYSVQTACTSPLFLTLYAENEPLSETLMKLGAYVPAEENFFMLDELFVGHEDRLLYVLDKQRTLLTRINQQQRKQLEEQQRHIKKLEYTIHTLQSNTTDENEESELKRIKYEKQ